MKKITTIAILFLISFNFSKATLSSYVKVMVNSCIAINLKPNDMDASHIDPSLKLICYNTLDTYAGAIESNIAAGLKTYACNIDNSKEDIRKKLIKFYYTRLDLQNLKETISLNKYLYYFFKQEYPCKKKL